MATYNEPQIPLWLPGAEIDHVGAAREHLKSVLPESSLNPSSVEMTLLEAFAVLLGPIAMSYQVVPAVVVEHFMGYYGLFRHKGMPATGKVKFYVSTASGTVTINSGTLIRHFMDDQTGTLEFRTTQTVTIITSETLEGEAEIVATEPGVSHNGVTPGTRMNPVDYMMNVERIEVTATTSGGAEAEDDASFQERAMALLERQTSALVHADQIESAVYSRPEVGRVLVVDNWDPATGAAGGNVTVAVTGLGGAALSETQKQAIEDWLDRQVIASLVVHVVDPTFQPVDLTLTVEAVEGAVHAEVEAAVVAELQRRLDPLTWDWWNDITTFDIASWIDDVPGVGRVVQVASGITLTGTAVLPQARTLSVTVTEPTR